MIELRASADGVVVPVHAQPRAKRNAITGAHNGRLKIAVTEPPEKGKANEAIARVLAEVLHVRPSRVRLIAGAASPVKRFVVTGTKLDSVRELLAKLVVE